MLIYLLAFMPDLVRWDLLIGVARTTQAPRSFTSMPHIKGQTEEAINADYKGSKLMDAFVNTESTNGASSPGCMVVGTIV